MCKNAEKKIPKNRKEWLIFLKDSQLKVDNHLLSALEIEHSILRASMALSIATKEIKDFPKKFAEDDPRYFLKIAKEEPLIAFSIFLPTK